MERQRILVIGAGVLGSLLAARLQDGGHDVSVLARGQRLRDLREHGIALEDDEGRGRTTTHVNVVERLAPEDAYDLALVVVQHQQTGAVLPALAANRHIPSVLFLQNNPCGPEALTSALGGARVLWGFPAMGGTRDGHVVRYTLAGRDKPKVVLGEPDGSITGRTRSVAAALERAGIAVELRQDMDAWLKHHAALVSPVALAIYAAAGDNYRLARTRDGIVLAIRAVREGVDALVRLGYPLSPPGLKVLFWLPEPVLVAVLKQVFASKLGETGMTRHANAAREEMGQLVDAVLSFGRKANMPMPYMTRLYAYLNPDMPPMPEGSRHIALDWREVKVLVVVIVALVALGMLLARRKGLRRR